MAAIIKTLNSPNAPIHGLTFPLANRRLAPDWKSWLRQQADLCVRYRAKRALLSRYEQSSTSNTTSSDSNKERYSDDESEGSICVAICDASP